MSVVVAAALLCLPYTEMVANRDVFHDQRQLVSAREDRGALVQVFVAKTGEWSMVIVGANRNACVIGSGTMFMMVPPGEMN